MHIGLSDLTKDQLLSLAVTIPGVAGAVEEELDRRTAFPGLEQGFTELAILVARLEQFLGTVRHTQSVKDMIALGLPATLKRLLATAKVKDINFTQPTLDQVM